MNFKRLLHTGLGKFFISILLGLGLSTLFRKVCTDKNCTHFYGPVLSEVDGKTYKYGDKCYKYTGTPTACGSGSSKTILEMKNSEKEQPKNIFGV
jgi:hypothetical protein